MSEQGLNPVVWFEIYVDDMERARAFYGKVLDIEFTQVPTSGLDMWAFPMQDNGGGAGGALAHHPDMKAGGNSTLVYFTCKDCAVEESRIADAGGQVLTSKMSIGEHGFVCHGMDTEGNMFGLHSEA